MGFDLTCDCDPYSPNIGELNTYIALGLIPSGGNWKFENTGSVAYGYYDYSLSYNNVIKDTIRIDDNAVVRWKFFAGNNFLLVNSQLDRNFQLYIYDLRENGNPHRSDVNFTAVHSGSHLEAYSSSDGLALFTFVSYGGSEQHTIYRTDNGDVLTSFPGSRTESITLTRKGEITAQNTAKISILTTPQVTILSENNFPIGELIIINNDQNFGELVLQDPANLPSSERTYTLKNDGNECLCVTDITDDPPFSMVQTSRSLPATLYQYDTMTVTVRFSPQNTTTSVSGSLSITCSPVNACNVTIDSGGSARGTAFLFVNNNNRTFDPVVVNGHSSLLTQTEAFIIENKGFAAFNLNSINDSNPFSCSSCISQLPHTLNPNGGSVTVQVIFESQTTGTFNNRRLQLNPTPPAEENAIVCNGKARTAHLDTRFNIVEDFGTIKLDEPTEPQEITNTLTISNDGEADLEITSIDLINKTGTGHVGFYLPQTTFPVQVPYSSHGTIDIIFRPTFPTIFSTDLSINYQWLTSPNMTVPNPEVMNLKGKAMRKFRIGFGNRWIWVIVLLIVLTIAYVLNSVYDFVKWPP